MEAFQDVDFNPPESLTFSDKWNNMCPFNYTKFYYHPINRRGHYSSVCIRNNLTKFKIYNEGVEATVDLNPEIMRKLFNFHSVEIGRNNHGQLEVRYIAAMIYTLPQNGDKYLIYGHFKNDIFVGIKSLCYGDKNQFSFEDYSDDYFPGRMDLMDTFILKRNGQLYKSIRDLSRLTDKQLLNLPHNLDPFSNYNPGHKDNEYELIYKGQMINEKFDTTGSRQKGIGYSSFFENEPFNNTIKYTGEWKDGLRHGKGENLFTNGDVYTGEWINGLRHGNGTCVFRNGDVYEGEWKNGLEDGEGMETFSSLDKDSLAIYKGHYKMGEKNGFGKLFNKNKLTGKTKLIFSGIWDGNKKPIPLSEIIGVGPDNVLASFFFGKRKSLVKNRKSLRKQKKSLVKNRKSKSKNK